LTDESTPSADLVAAVKQLYNTLKDASILIPLLPSFPKEEVYVSNFITPSNVPNLWWCFNFDHLVCLMQTFVFLVVQIYLGVTWQYGMPN